MTDAADPGSRRTLLVRRLMERRGQRDELVVCAGEHSEPANNASGEAESWASDPVESRDERRIRYGDRQLTLFPDATERDRLDELLDEYPVFKLDAPATRKSEDGTVYVSAVADPKHLADFIEDCCRQVYDLPTGYALSVE
jgi:hypothetical protein